MKILRTYFQCLDKAVVCFLILALMSGWFFLTSYELLPVDHDDEALYLSQGFTKHINIAWSVLYSKFYSLLFLFLKDQFFVYKLMFFLNSFVLLPSIFFFLTVRLTKSSYAALVVSLFVLFHGVNVPTIPKVQIFNCVVLIISYLILTFDNRLMSLIVATVIAILSIHIRQDNVFVIPLFVVLLMNRNLPNTIKCLTLLGLSLFAGIVFWYVGSPFTSDRMLYSVIDHFSWFGAAAKFVDSPINATVVINDVFKNPSNIIELIQNNPRAFIVHIQNNLKLLIGGLGSVYKVLVNHHIFSAIFFVFCILVFGFEQHKQGSSRNNKIFLLFSFLVIAKSIFLSILLSPQAKYLCDAVLLLPLVCGSLLSLFFSARKTRVLKLPFAKTVAISSCFVLLFDTNIHGFAVRQGSFMSNRILIEHFNSTRLRESSNAYSHHLYLGYAGYQGKLSGRFQFLIWHHENRQQRTLFDYFNLYRFDFIVIPGFSTDQYYFPGGIDFPEVYMQLTEIGCETISLPEGHNSYALNCKKAKWSGS